MTKKIKIGNFFIGGGERIALQSMTNTCTADFSATFSQINALKEAGCDIIRLAVSNMDEVLICKKYLEKIDVPLVADIQYDYKLAIACSEIGFHKIRFNPGNIGSDIKVKELAKVCRDNYTPIRIGVNAGSLSKEILDKYGRTAEGMVESALQNVVLLEKAGFHDIVVSLKSSNVVDTVKACRLFRERCDYPLHIGVTESGYGKDGLIKSAIGIGSLLLDGIGDTIRVSLSGNPVNEVYAAKDILSALRLINERPEIISCPTCSRCKYDLEQTVKDVTEACKDIKKGICVAVMGCAVNGIGEASTADVGVAGSGDGRLVLFSDGKIIDTFEPKIALEKLITLIKERTIE